MYCNQRVCLSVLEDISGQHAQSLPIFVHVAYGRGSVLPRRRCNMLCTSGFVDDITRFSTMGRIAVQFRYEGPISLKFTYLP